MDYIFYQVGRHQRLRLVRPLPARRADRQPVLDLRRHAGRAAARRTSLGAAATVGRRVRRRVGRPESLVRTAPALAGQDRSRRARAATARRRHDGRRSRRRERAAAAATPAPAGDARGREPVQDRHAARLPVREATADARRGAGIAGNPVLIGAATVLVVHRRRLPVLQRQPGPAVRARPTSSRPRSPSAANLVLGNEVRIGGARVGAVDAITAAAADDDGTNVAVLGAQARARPSPRCRKDSTLLIRPRSALGLKYVEITRGTSTRAASRTATRSRSRTPRPTPVEFDEFLEHVRRQDARAPSQANLRGLRRRASPAAASRSTPRSARFRPLLRDVIPVAQNLSAPGHRPRRASSSSCSATTARSSRPRPRRRPSCSSNLDTTFARAARGRPAVHPGLDHRGRRRRSTPAIRNFPRQRPFLRNSRGAVPRAAPRRARAADARRRRLADALDDGHADAARARRRSTAGSPRCCRSCSASPRTRWSRAASRRLTETLNALQPDARLPGARRRRTCNYVTLWFRNVASLLSEGDAQRHLAALHHRPDAAGPEQRGQPVVRAGQRPDASQPPARQPVPEHRRRRASRRSARRATSRTCAAQTVIGERRPATQPATTERHDADGRGARATSRAARSSIGLIALAVVIVARCTSASRRTSRSRTAVPASTRCSQSANSIRAGLAGADRRRQGRQGQGDRAAGGHATRRRRGDGDQRPRAAAPRRRDRQDPAAHLPRGQLLRRPHAGHAAARRSCTTATRSRSPRRRRRSSSTRC